MEMILKKYRTISGKKIVVFDKFMEVPSWIFWWRHCDKCGEDIGGEYGEFIVGNCIVAMESGTLYVFHKKCWEEYAKT